MRLTESVSLYTTFQNIILQKMHRPKAH